MVPCYHPANQKVNLNNRGRYCDYNISLVQSSKGLSSRPCYIFVTLNMIHANLVESHSEGAVAPSL